MTKKLLWAIALVALVVATGAGAIAAAGENTESAGNSIAGSWNVIVNRPAPLAPLASLQVFTSDGSWIEMSNEPQASRTPQFGSWERIDGRHYAASGMIFRYDAAGTHVATMRINRNMLLSPDGQTMTVAARATTYDLSGNVISSFPVRATGERMEVERIPDQP